MLFSGSLRRGKLLLCHPGELDPSDTRELIFFFMTQYAIAANYTVGSAKKLAHHPGFLQKSASRSGWARPTGSFVAMLRLRRSGSGASMQLEPNVRSARPAQ
jgi:hypothetical protein